MRRTFLLVCLFLVSAVATALAQPVRDHRQPRPPLPIKVEWDSRGWQLLGEQTVQGRVDRDRIQVGRYEGRFSKLQLVVHDSDLELLDFTIHFGDGTRYEPRLQHYFREGQRTRAFDLPPNGGIIRHIDLKYRNLPGGGRARVQVWGFKIADVAPPPPPPPPRVDWDSRGWTLLGEQTISGRIDRDRIVVGRAEGSFTKLMLVGQDSDFELLDFEVTFANGERWRPARLAHYFREGQRTRAIDLPGARRKIAHINLRYRNLPGGGRARVQVYGRSDGAGPGYTGVWDNRGWTMLGEQVVHGRVDRDRIVVGRDEGKFRKLMIVVLDSDLELLSFDVKLARGPAWQPNVRQFFREGTRTRAIDLPGDRRVIRHIDLTYRNLPGGGRARVQVWGR
jgi:hypothetical protein